MASALIVNLELILEQLLHAPTANQMMVILTAGYLIATIILVKHAAKQAAITKQTLDFYARAEHDRFRPYVIFDMIYEGSVAYAKMRNVGILPALDIHVSVTPKLRWNEQDEGVAFIEKGISFLAPGRELSEPFSHLEKLQKMAHLKFSGKVAYRDTKGLSYEEPFAIDLTYILTQGYIRKTTAEEHLKDIEDVLKQIADASAKPRLIRTIAEPEYKKQEEERRLREAEEREKFKAAMAKRQADEAKRKGEQGQPT